MKGNNKYIYICLAVVILAIVGYVAIYKLDILKNKNNDKETTKIEVAKTEVSTNDELLNDPNVKYGKEETGEILKNKMDFDMIEDISKKEIRRKLSDNIVIAKVSKINGARNVDPKTGEETLIMTEGELEILDVLKGDIKDKNIKFRRVGGKMNYAEYLKGSPIKREKLKNNPEMDIYSKEEKEKMMIEECANEDIKLEEGKTYLMYLKYNKELGTNLVKFYQYGTRELEPIQKNTMQKALSNYKTTNKVERKSKSKK
jgi:hypothetical protein